LRSRTGTNAQFVSAALRAFSSSASITKILWGQIITVFLIVLTTTWTATEWVAWRLAFQSELRGPWFHLFGFPFYPPPLAENQSQSLVAEAAIASFLSPDGADRREAAFAKRLDQIDRRMARTERDVGIGIETLAVFIRFWLATTPALPEPAAQAARAKAGERYDAFVTALGRRLAKGPRLRQEIPEDSMGEGGSALPSQPLKTE
jgi:hypothetical protein